MYQLIYTSQAVVPLGDSGLKALLEQSQQWNEQVGLTGLLLYSNEHFVQVLEGSVEVVGDLFKKILRDVRHHNVTRLASGRIAERRFTQWSMAFQAVEPAQMARVRGYFTPQNLALHYQDLTTPDEMLLQVIESFMHQPPVTYRGLASRTLNG